MYTITIFDAEKILIQWSCTAADSPARYVKGSHVLKMQMEEGVMFNSYDHSVVAKLQEQWKLPVQPLDDRKYLLEDGVNYLLALYATYSRASRFRAVASRKDPV